MKAMTTPSAAEPRRGRPASQLGGYKIFNSPFRQAISQILLETGSVAQATHYLEDHGLPCTYTTVKLFAQNYLPEVKATLPPQESPQDNNSLSRPSVDHSGISRVESLVKILNGAQEQMEQLESKRNKSVRERLTFLKHADFIVKKRADLEYIRLRSEVERERTDGIKATAKLALLYLLNQPKVVADDFIKRCADLTARRDPGKPQLSTLNTTRQPNGKNGEQPCQQ